MAAMDFLFQKKTLPTLQLVRFPKNIFIINLLHYKDRKIKTLPTLPLIRLKNIFIKILQTSI